MQRGRRGWADSDVWEMAWYLAEVIAGMAAHLREHSMGYACVHEPADHAEHHKAGCDPKDWENVLRRIEYGLRYFLWAQDHVDDGQPTFAVYEERERIQYGAVEQSLALMQKHWGHLWD